MHEKEHEGEDAGDDGGVCEGTAFLVYELLEFVEAFVGRRS